MAGHSSEDLKSLIATLGKILHRINVERGIDKEGEETAIGSDNKDNPKVWHSSRLLSLS